MESIENEPYWNDIVSAFPELSVGDVKRERCSDEHFTLIKSIIIEKKKTDIVSGMAINNILNELNLNMSTKFWVHFLDKENIKLSCLQSIEEYCLSDFTGFEHFKKAIDEFFDLTQSHLFTIDRLQSLYKNNKTHMLFNYHAQICVLLCSRLPSEYNTIVYQFYKTALRVICKDQKVIYKNKLFMCDCCNFERINCKCAYILKYFFLTNWKLNKIGILESISGDVIIELMKNIIETYVKTKTKNNFTERQFLTLEKWVNIVVYDWMKLIFKPKSTKKEVIDNPNLDVFMSQLKRFFYKSYVKTRIIQLYDIIIRYPYSELAVIDLSIALQEISYDFELSEHLQNAIERRLQPDLSTLDVLYMYTVSIKVLRKIDPSGLLLKGVSRSIHAYLQNRKDIVQSIVFIISTECHNFIVEFFKDNISLTNENVIEEMKVIDQVILNSLPESSESSIDCVIVTLLIDIFGSRGSFINEYKALLADRLLVSYSLEKFVTELKCFSFFETKIGEPLLKSCTIMLKDVFDSRCINKHLYFDPDSNSKHNIYNYDLQFPIKAIIVSAQYWPKFKDYLGLNLPPDIKRHLEYYVKCFEELKKDRTLIWIPNLGKVDLDITLNGKTLNFCVSPIHATIIWHFQIKMEWTTVDLCKEMNISVKTVKLYIKFWINKGVLIEVSSDSFKIVTSLSKRDNPTVDGNNDLSILSIEDGTMESAVISPQDQRNSELQEFWSYMEGLFRTQNSTTFERILGMWKMYTTQGNVDLDNDLTELHNLLEKKINERRIILSEGLYTLAQ